jgi:hypothetical protein
MADKKISALTAASTPLAGTEVLPIVQSGTTVKVSVANLTAGRAVAMAGGSFTDNITQSTAGKGIDFTANTPAAGMTSELLNWYEEGTWTPVDASGASLVYTGVSGYYTRTGNVVTARGRVTFPTTASGLTALIGGLPFAAANNNQPGGGFVRLTNSGRSDTLSVGATTTTITLYSNILAAATNVQYTGARIDFVVIYQV